MRHQPKTILLVPSEILDAEAPLARVCFVRSTFERGPEFSLAGEFLDECPAVLAFSSPTGQAIEEARRLADFLAWWRGTASPTKAMIEAGAKILAGFDVDYDMPADDAARQVYEAMERVRQAPAT